MIFPSSGQVPALGRSMKFSHARKHLFYTELAKLITAGFGIRDAVRVMLDARPQGAEATLLDALDRSLASGTSITGAFAANGSAISELEQRLIGAGERAGRLGPAFEQLADYFGMLAGARRDALAGMAYPLFLLHLGLFTAVLVPGLMSQAGLTSILADFFILIVLLYAGLGGIGMGLRALMATARHQAGRDRLLNALPLVGRTRRALAMARFTKVYHGCLLAGLPMAETVETAAQASASGALAEAGRQLLLALGRGAALGPVFLSCDAFPPAFARSYSTAEECGGLDTDLARWSAWYQEEAATAMKLTGSLLAKGFYFIVLIFVAWTVLRAYGGYLAELDKI
ncbi:MAG: hypothetical protein EAZ65_03070 [Verrucomicrobia bacterium]|nr:MAG: hypothetical protein EAZ84_02120 [Verrucomicrobiota bacterium]TAE88362.1 MAG: hypothetical protein EAZ82_03755 [Verrucomicrobiota bacterium]TAF26816.1 MAG: hypothetical protein EAZ71_03065 [Verrucomicrobiota bacterium]TAF42073.1 MAG: hypothetical protein EAZ65_03070 [Verrucomicrobiota bacterium]